MLFDSKENLSRQVFDKRVELRCLEIDCDVKEKALEESRRSLSEMLKSSDRNEEWIRAIADLSDEDIEATRRGVKNFDYLFEKLTERTDIEKRALELLPREKEIPRAAERAAHLERRLANLDAKAAELEEKLDYELNVFVNTGALKVSLAQAANEAEILGGLTEAFNETRVASAIIYDKVKSVVAYADSLLKIMSEGRLGVSFENELVFSDSEQNAIELAGIENTDRLLVYLSLLLAQPAHNGERGNWLIVDERIVCNRLKLNKALSLLDVEYAHRKNFLQSVKAPQKRRFCFWKRVNVLSILRRSVLKKDADAFSTRAYVRKNFYSKRCTVLKNCATILSIE